MKFVRNILKKYVLFMGERINTTNRSRLINKEFSIICSNCAGGIIYHWLGLKFYSPFINLFLSNEDFILALENWDDFINADIEQDLEAPEKYPVGIGYANVRIHFMHYDTFEEATEKWNERKTRIDLNNCVVMLTNFNENKAILERFSKLHFANKLVFTRELYPEFECAVFLSGYKKFSDKVKARGGVPNIWNIRNYITGKRFIDEFDYVAYFNSIKEIEK